MGQWRKPTLKQLLTLAGSALALAGCNPMAPSLDSSIFEAAHLPGIAPSPSPTATASSVAVLSIAANTFSDTTVGNTHAAVTFTATNSGGSTATLSLAPALTTGTRFAITGGTCTNGGTIAAGATCTMTVTFTPAAGATYNDTLTLTYNDSVNTGQTATRAISGNGLTVASLAIAANTFSDTTVGNTHAAVTFTATNSGGSTATLSLAPALTTGTRFAITGGTCANGGTIAAGATCTMTVTFTPAAGATYNDTLTLTYNNGAAAGQTATRAISGNGLTAATLAIAANTFSDTTVGNTHAAVTFTATNTGGSTATLSLAPALTTGTRFAITGGTCANGGTIAAGATCTMTVTFTPAAGATYNDTLTLTYNDSVTAGQTATRAITGNGITVASLAIAANTFSDTTVGNTHSAVTFTATNSGGSTATLSLAPALTTGTRFAITGGTCTNGGTIAAGATCTMTVTFTPAAAATYNDTLTLTYNNGAAAGQTATRAITGNGLTVASLAIAANTFSTIYVGDVTSAVTFTVTNSGGSTATISSRTFTTGTNFSSLGGTCTVASTVAAGATCTLTVVFSPIAPSTSNDTLNLGYSNGAAAGQSATRAISAIALVPIGVVPDGFAATPAGATTVDQTVTFTNNSSLGATGFTRALTTGLEITIVSTTCGASLASGASCTATLRFSPGVPLTIANDLSYTAAYADTLTAHYTVGAVTRDYTTSIDGSAAPYYSGTGSVADPYHIRTEKQLRVLNAFSDSNLNFTQDNNIDLQGFDGSGTPDPAKNWDSIAFTGNYDGGGFKILNLYADQSISGSGSFIHALRLGSLIKNLTIENINALNINGDPVAGIVATVEDSATLQDVHVLGASGKRSLTGKTSIGGLVGNHTAGTLTITDSSVDIDIDGSVATSFVGGLIAYTMSPVTITGSTTAGSLLGSPAGGLIGRATQDIHITTSTSSMSVTESNGGSGFGGLVGFLDGGVASEITDSFFAGSILATNGDSAGGIVGTVTATGLTVTNCGSTANVTAIQYAGGLVGMANSIEIRRSFSAGTITVSSRYGGGFAGALSWSTLSDSYALGNVYGPDGGLGLGGFVGYNDASQYTNTYSGILDAVTTPSNSKMNGFIGEEANAGTYSNAIYFSGNNVAADPIGATTGLSTPDSIDQSKYLALGFDFTPGHNLWAMPSAVPGSVPGGVLSPVLRWQCTMTGYTCL